jgi:hypothetical protein
MPTNPLSRKIPALLMRIVTPPKVSNAVLITIGPSVTEELFTTALPTPPTSYPVRLEHMQEGATKTHLR